MPQQYRTREQVQQYLAQIFSPDKVFQIYQFEHGWVCRPTLTPEQTANGQGLGLGNYVVNAETGVVTAHASLAPTIIGEMYDEAIRTGQPVQGHQVYPPRWKVTIDRIREDPIEVEYLVHVSSPTEPAVRHQLIIDKQTLRSRTETEANPTACAHAKAWAHANRNPDGTWPARGTFTF